MKAFKTIIPMADKDICYLCWTTRRLRTPATEPHHCLSGSYRKLADEDGLIIPICRQHHRELHDKGTYDKEMKKLAQECWINTYGTREDFIRRYNKSWE